MAENESKSKTNVTNKGADRALAKEKRLAAALRENLKRRKPQKSGEAGSEPDQGDNS